jgi:hypothetical protein
MKKVIEYKLFYHTTKGYGNIWLRLENSSDVTELNQLKPDAYAAICATLTNKNVFFDGTWFSTLENIPQKLTVAPHV